MALIGRPFAEVYNELVAYEPTLYDRLRAFSRDEVGCRKDIEAMESADFADMLHIAALWIAEKKQRERGGGPGFGKHARALYDKQHAVWTPTAPPRMPSGCRLGFSKAKYRELCEEEAELRRWLHGVEARLREHIEHACQESFYILNCFDSLYLQEERRRVRVEIEEDDAFKAIRRSVFKAAPSDYYRTKAVERFGRSARCETPPPRELTFEETETFERERLEAAELAGRQQAHQYLVGCYDQRLFEVNHQEVFFRELLEKKEVDARYPLLARCCREDFGFCYYHTPAVFLHLQPAHRPTSMMAQMCAWHLANINRNALDVKYYLEHGCAPGEHKDVSAAAVEKDQLQEYPEELDGPHQEHAEAAVEDEAPAAPDAENHSTAQEAPRPEEIEASVSEVVPVEPVEASHAPEHAPQIVAVAITNPPTVTSDPAAPRLPAPVMEAEEDIPTRECTPSGLETAITSTTTAPVLPPINNDTPEGTAGDTQNAAVPQQDSIHDVEDGAAADAAPEEVPVAQQEEQTKAMPASPMLPLILSAEEWVPTAEKRKSISMDAQKRRRSRMSVDNTRSTSEY